MKCNYNNIPDFVGQDTVLRSTEYLAHIQLKGETPTHRVQRELRFSAFILPQARSLDGRRAHGQIIHPDHHKEWVFFRSVTDGLPPGLTSLDKVDLCLSVKVYDPYTREKVVDLTNVFMIASHELDNALFLEYTYLPLGFLEPVTFRFPITDFTHTPTKFFCLTVTTPDGQDIAFARWVDDELNFDEGQYPEHEILGCDFVSIKNAFQESVMQGNKLTMFKPRLSRIDYRDYGGIDI